MVSNRPRLLLPAALLGVALVSSLPVHAEPADEVHVSNPVLDDPSGAVPVSGSDDADLPPVPPIKPFTRTPWQERVRLTLPDGHGDAGGDVLIVPPGRWLVVESVTISGVLPPGQFVSQFVVGTGVDGLAEHSFLPVHRVGPVTANTDRHATHVETRLYCNPSGAVYLIVGRSGGDAGQAHFTVTLSGYFVPEGSPTLSP